jgi:hypothetical protein
VGPEPSRRTWLIAESLEPIAYVIFRLAAADTAACICAGAERPRERVGAPLPPRERPRDDLRVAATRAAMADAMARFDRAWQEGRRMTWRRYWITPLAASDT